MWHYIALTWNSTSPFGWIPEISVGCSSKSGIQPLSVFSADLKLCLYFYGFSRLSGWVFLSFYFLFQRANVFRNGSTLMCPCCLCCCCCCCCSNGCQSNNKKKLGQQERLKAGTTKTSGVRKHTHTHVCTHKAGLAKCK